MEHVAGGSPSLAEDEGSLVVDEGEESSPSTSLGVQVPSLSDSAPGLVP